MATLHLYFRTQVDGDAVDLEAVADLARQLQAALSRVGDATGTSVRIEGDASPEPVVVLGDVGSIEFDGVNIDAGEDPTPFVATPKRAARRK